MDEALTHILEACKLARDLEAGIRQGYNNPNYLLKSSEEIVTAFNEAMSLFSSPNSSLPVSSNMVVGTEGSSHRATSLFQALNLAQQSGGFDQQASAAFFDHAQLERLGQLEMLPNVSTVATGAIEIGGGSGYAGNVFEATNNAEVERVPAARNNSSGSGRRPAGSSGQRSNRRRRDNGERMTERVPAVRTGNTEMPPDDGYTWRKYGQKDILGCRFPRSYFRCTHKNYYGCEAKKQVQRLDEDPYTYEIVYCGRHTCLTSTTPLLLSSLAVPATTAMMMTSAVAPMITTSAVASTSNVTTNPHIGSSMIGATMPEMAPSTSIQLGSWINRESVDGRLVSDMADVLFNSGSSSSSMDAIFYSKPEN